MSDEWDLSDDEIDRLVGEWEEIDREAAAFLDDHVPATGPTPDADLRGAVRALDDGVVRGVWPFDYFIHALGWHAGVPEDHASPWLEALAATVSPPNDPQTDIEQQSSVMALQHADWLGIVIGLVRRGVGAELAPESMLEDIASLEDIDGEVEDPDGHLSVLETATATLFPLWRALGVVDEHDRLTTLGRWGLPRALRRVWVGADDDRPR